MMTVFDPSGHAEHLDDARHGANVMQVSCTGVFDLGIALGHHADVVSSGVGFLQELQALVAPNVDGQDHAGEENGVAEGQDGQVFRGGFPFAGGLVFRTQQGNAELVFGVIG